MKHKKIIAYVPVLHQGYIQFLSRHSDEETHCYILGHDVLEHVGCDYLLRKEIREVDPEIIASSLQLALRRSNISCEGVTVAHDQTLRSFTRSDQLIMPDEDISRMVATSYFSDSFERIVFDTVFLRWHRDNTLISQQVQCDEEIELEQFSQDIINLADSEAQKAANWWRQVGAVAFRGRDILFAFSNQHVPSPHMPYIEGDPRNCAKRGQHIEISTDHHAEARIISAAARTGVALQDADMFVTVFPCPPCAKSVAAAGIRTLYFRDGYAMADGERILRSSGVRIVHVKQ